MSDLIAQWEREFLSYLDAVLKAVNSPDLDAEACRQWPDVEVEDVAHRMGFSNVPFLIATGTDANAVTCTSLILHYPDDAAEQAMAIESYRTVYGGEDEGDDDAGEYEYSDGPLPDEGEMEDMWEREFSEQDKDDIRAVVYAWRRAIKAKSGPTPPIANASRRPTRELTETEQDIVDALNQAGQRLTGPALAMAARGSEDHGSLKQLLASMVREGIITSSRDAKPPGYGLPGWPP